MEKKLKEIFSEVFDIKLSDINDMSSPDNIAEWDSLKHTNLIVALEEGFNVSFTLDEIIEMLNFKLIKIILKKKLNTRSRTK